MLTHYTRVKNGISRDCFQYMWRNINSILSCELICHDTDNDTNEDENIENGASNDVAPGIDPVENEYFDDNDEYVGILPLE